MGFPCCNESCGKQFSTKFNRNIHERIKGHSNGDARPVQEIPFNNAAKVYMCPTVNCRASSKNKYNIIKHLKSCYQVNSNNKVADNKKICSICHKHFLKKSNRDRHMTTIHQNDSEIADPEESVQHLNDDGYLHEELPTMVYNVANQVRFLPSRLNKKYHYPFNLQNQVSFLLFLHLNLPTYLPPCLLTDPPAALTAASSSSLPTNPPAAPTAASSSSFLTDPSAALTAASSSNLPNDQPAVPTVTL